MGLIKGGKDGDKAISLDGEDDYIKLKKPINLSGKPFTICVWFNHDKEHPAEGKQWDEELPLISGDKDTLRAGFNGFRDPFFGFYHFFHWRHPKPDKGKWNFICFQLQARHLAKQTGGTADGTMDVQEETWETAMRIFINGTRDTPGKLKPNQFYDGNLSYIGTFWGNEKFKGLISDVKVYERDLSGNEIAELYNEGIVRFPTVRDGLTFWLKFDDGL